MLTIETRSLDRLIPYVRNARTHSEDQVAQIAASIAEFGFTNPILIGADDVVIAGHGRLLAAKLALFALVMAAAALHGWGSSRGRPGFARTMAVASLAGSIGVVLLATGLPAT